MTKLLGWVAATTITAAAIVTATPAVAFHGSVFGGGMHFGGRGCGGIGGMRMGRQVSAGGLHNPACFRHRRHFRDVVSVGGPFFYDYVPYFDWVLHDGTYCWQQVWTPSGWQWVDACPGYHGYAY